VTRVLVTIHASSREKITIRSGQTSIGSVNTIFNREVGNRKGGDGKRQRETDESSGEWDKGEQVHVPRNSGTRRQEPANGRARGIVSPQEAARERISKRLRVLCLPLGEHFIE